MADDPFAAVINAEERLHQSGYEAGNQHGQLEGRIDGFATGQIKGMEVGDEVGYYLGFVEKMLDLKSEDKGDRLYRLLSSLLEEIKDFHCLDLSSPRYQEDIRKIRGKFKLVSSILKFKPQPGTVGQFLTKQSF